MIASFKERSLKAGASLFYLPLLLSMGACSFLFSESGTAVAPDAAITTVDAAPGRDTDAGLISMDLHIKADDDDAEENGDNVVSLQGQKLSLGAYGSSSGRTVGLRYQGVDIPAGSTLVRAQLQFEAADDGQNMDTVLGIRAELSPDAPAFLEQNNNLSNRAATGMSVSWMVPAWETQGEKEGAQRSPPLQDVLQEVINQSGWATGNSLVILITGIPGRRDAKAYPSGAPPVLHVQYLAAD